MGDVLVFVTLVFFDFFSFFSYRNTGFVSVCFDFYDIASVVEFLCLVITVFVRRDFFIVIVIVDDDLGLIGFDDAIDISIDIGVVETVVHDSEVAFYLLIETFDKTDDGLVGQEVRRDIVDGPIYVDFGIHSGRIIG